MKIKHSIKEKEKINNELWIINTKKNNIINKNK